MKRQLLVGTMLVVGAAWLGVFAQAPGAVARTPWGDPDLQGVWTSEPELNVPFERAPELGDRQTLTEAEFEQRRVAAQKQLAIDNAEFDVETADTANAGAVGSATLPPRIGSSAARRRAGRRW